MSKTGSEGAKDVFFSHENIVIKIYPLHHSNPKFVNGIQNYTYVGIYTQEQYKIIFICKINFLHTYLLFWLEAVRTTHLK